MADYQQRSEPAAHTEATYVPAEAVAVRQPQLGDGSGATLAVQAAALVPQATTYQTQVEAMQPAGAGAALVQLSADDRDSGHGEVQRVVIRSLPDGHDFDDFVSNVGTLNDMVAAFDAVFEGLSRVPQLAEQAEDLLRGSRHLSHMVRGLRAIGRAGPWVTVAGGVHAMVTAETGPDAAMAMVDTCVHLGMATNPITAVIDFTLSAVFGPNWPTAWIEPVAEFTVAMIEAVVAGLGGVARAAEGVALTLDAILVGSELGPQLAEWFHRVRLTMRPSNWSIPDAVLDEEMGEIFWPIYHHLHALENEFESEAGINTYCSFAEDRTLGELLSLTGSGSSGLLWRIEDLTERLINGREYAQTSPYDFVLLVRELGLLTFETDPVAYAAERRVEASEASRQALQERLREYG